MEKTPQCSICKRFYSSADDDGSGLCLTCRPTNSRPLLKQPLVQPGKFGVTNAQMIPAIQKAIAQESIETLTELKATYFYIFERSIKYLRKKEQEYINNHVK